MAPWGFLVLGLAIGFPMALVAFLWSAPIRPEPVWTADQRRVVAELRTQMARKAAFVAVGWVGWTLIRGGPPEVYWLFLQFAVGGVAVGWLGRRWYDWRRDRELGE